MSLQESTGSDFLYKLWAWTEDNLKPIVIATGICAAVLLIGSYYSYSQKQKEITAGQALSQAIIAGGTSPQADAYLKVATEYPATLAGQRALLEGAAALFTAGKFPEAQTQFQKFLDTDPDHFLAPTALLGVAASLDAQGKTDLAIAAYQRAAGQTANISVTVSAKFAAARIYDAQGKTDAAVKLYEEIIHAYPNSPMSNEAGVRAMELKKKMPAAPVKPAPAAAAPFNLSK